MQRHHGVVQSKGGRVVVGALIQVFITGTNTPVSLYSDRAGTQEIAQLLTDNEGEYEFYAANGRVDIKTIVNGRVDGQAIDVLLFDPDDVPDEGVDEAVQAEINGVKGRLTTLEEGQTTLSAQIQEVDSKTKDFDSAHGTEIVKGNWADGRVAPVAELADNAGAYMIGYRESTVGDALDEIVSIRSFGAKGSGADDTNAVIRALNDLKDGQILDLCGGSYALYGGVAGVASGDAVAIANTVRLANKNNITIRNGTLYAASPGANVSKVRFPSTFAVDGCTNIRFQSVRFIAKGENWGDSDASEALGFEQRRPFLAQNGGHACVVIRSKDVFFDDSCRFERAGSVGAFYSSSSDNVVINSGYASAESLGYAAFALDGWCGGAAESGYAQFRLYLNNCRSGNNGADYGSKGCVVVEDRDSYAYVNGGVYKDAYANGAATQLGAAFISNGSHVYVHGAWVENCAAIGMTTNVITDDTVIEVSGVTARAMRTAMHIIDRTSFGAHKIKFRNCDAEINGTSLWSDVELSRSSVVANRKVSTVVDIDIINCVTKGAHTFAINERASYGGIRVIGGDHSVTERIFDSAGWGGASATGRGIEVLSGARFKITRSTSGASTALTQAVTSINAVKNQDTSNVFTYQYVLFDRTVTVESSFMREFITLLTLGTNLKERIMLAQSLVGCYQSTVSEPRVGNVRMVSANGVSGSNVRVTFAILDNKCGNAMTLVDDVLANRRDQGSDAGYTVSGNELHYSLYLNGTSYNLTTGAIYPVIFA